MAQEGQAPNFDDQLIRFWETIGNLYRGQELSVYTYMELYT